MPSSASARKDQERSQQTTLEQLQERLHLRNFPRRIECFDMSNIQGTNPVWLDGGLHGMGAG